MTAGPPLLAVEGLARTFGALAAVNGVSLTVAAGERRAVIGPNGAGKTTLFNLITGHLAPTRGRIMFDGRSVTGLPPHAVARRGISRSFQRNNLFPALTVLESLRLAAAARMPGSYDLLDEPTAGMSPEETQRMTRMLERLPREVPLLIIEHDMDVVGSLADRVTVLHYGEVLTEGTFDEIKTDPRVYEVYLGAA